MWNMTLRVCLNRSVFLLFSLSRELSPFLLHEHVLSLLVSKLCILSLHSLYKFHVSCFVFSHFNSLPPASLSLLLHFNCDFHSYLTRSRSTCTKCPSGKGPFMASKAKNMCQWHNLMVEWGTWPHPCWEIYELSSLKRHSLILRPIISKLAIVILRQQFN